MLFLQIIPKEYLSVHMENVIPTTVNTMGDFLVSVQQPWWW